jgi:anti-anti-sigma factor
METSLLSATAPPLAPQGAEGAPRIEVGVTERPAETVVHVAGEASVGQVDKLSGALLSLSARRPSLITLDLSGLSGVSCLAMGVLVSFRRGVVRAGGRVRLAPTLQKSVREALARAELIELFGLPKDGEAPRAGAA